MNNQMNKWEPVHKEEQVYVPVLLRQDIYKAVTAGNLLDDLDDDLVHPMVATSAVVCRGCGMEVLRISHRGKAPNPGDEAGDDAGEVEQNNCAAYRCGQCARKES